MAVRLLTCPLVPPPAVDPLSNQSQSSFPQLVRNLLAGIPQSWSPGHAAMKFGLGTEQILTGDLRHQNGDPNLED